MEYSVGIWIVEIEIAFLGDGMDHMVHWGGGWSVEEIGALIVDIKEWSGKAVLMVPH